MTAEEAYSLSEKVATAGMQARVIGKGCGHEHSVPLERPA